MRKQNKHLVEHGSPEKSFSHIDSSQCDLAAEHQQQQKQAEVGEHQQRCPALERQAFENVDRIQTVNVAHKRSSVAFIGYKPKRTRGFKIAPNRSSSTKAIKHCFVCGEVVHVAKDCPRRFVEKNKVDKITHEYTVGGISVEHDSVKDKSDANLELDTFPFSACYTVVNDTVKAHVVDVPATKKDTNLSENDSMMPLVDDDAQRRDILNCIRVNQIEIVQGTSFNCGSK
uniref:CCHC-type domain-containing protein n=1 Tax=Panagrolaimus superbus TaxID=310955 RepID=A0A914YIN5_9BILA